LVLAVSTICSAAPVVDYNMLWQTSKHETISSCDFGLYIFEDGNSSSKIFTTVISPSDTGTTFTTTSTDPGFSDFVNFITNGTNGSVVVELKSPGGRDLGGWFLESDVFGKPSSGISDLQGCDPISSVSLKINNFELSSPADDGWGDGICTYVNCDFEFSVFVPEPSTITLLLIGLPLFCRKQK
jgi:hypothetical protein